MTTVITAVGTLPAGATAVRTLMPLSGLSVNSRREIKFPRNSLQIFLEVFLEAFS
jgi:hypothetical protein